MTVEQLASNVKDFNRTVQIYCAGAVIWLLLIVTLSANFGRDVHDFFHRQLSDFVAGAVLCSTAIALILPCAAILIPLFKIKQFGVSCPQCGTPFTTQSRFQRVIATQLCPKCGAIVIENETY